MSETIEEIGHSAIGASGMSRWSKCPGSVRLCRGLPNEGSEYAAEGTVAHDLGEKALRFGPAEVGNVIGTTRKVGRHTITITMEMLEAVQQYLDHVRDLRNDAPDHIEFIEHGFHLEQYHPDLWGTADYILYDKKTRTLFVRDYKHGAGVPVEVAGNLQLRYYALGALMSTNVPVSLVNVGIVQPRCPHPDGPARSVDIDPVDLLDWGAELADLAKATDDPDAPLVPGPVQCRWCIGAPICDASLELARKAAKMEFAEEAGGYDPDRLAEALELADTLDTWTKTVRQIAYAEAEHGRCPTGYKLVEKRATRKWTDEFEAQKALLAYGCDDKDIFGEPSLKTVAQIEKVIGKKELDELFAPLVIKQSSGLTLVPESDKREAVRTDAKSDFEEVA